MPSGGHDRVGPGWGSMVDDGGNVFLVGFVLGQDCRKLRSTLTEITIRWATGANPRGLSRGRSRRPSSSASAHVLITLFGLADVADISRAVSDAYASTIDLRPEEAASPGAVVDRTGFARPPPRSQTPFRDDTSGIIDAGKLSHRRESVSASAQAAPGPALNRALAHPPRRAVGGQQVEERHGVERLRAEDAGPDQTPRRAARAR